MTLALLATAQATATNAGIIAVALALIAAVPGTLAWWRNRQSDKQGFTYKNLELLINSQTARLDAAERRLDECEKDKTNWRELYFDLLRKGATP